MSANRLAATPDVLITWLRAFCLRDGGVDARGGLFGMEHVIHRTYGKMLVEGASH